jgi:hypothetical protein
MRDFSVDFVGFANPASLGRVVDSPPRHQADARTTAISHLRPVQDGFDYWEKTVPGPLTLPSRFERRCMAWLAPALLVQDLPHPGCSDVAEGTLRGLPASMFINNSSRSYRLMQEGRSVQ